jgi:predicted SprT family Zn-dependent metalloprotease
MKIKNETHWETKHIRAFVSEVMKRSPEHLRRKYIDNKYRTHLDIRVVYNRQVTGSITGYAWYNSWSMTLRLPSQAVDKTDLALTIAHELAHTLGYKHRDMDNGLFRHVGNWREIYAWAETMPLEHKAKAVKPKGTDLQLQRYERTVASIERWSTKLKRAQSALRKLTTKRRYYERALAAKGVPKK